MRDWLRDHAEVPTDNIEFVVSYDQDSAEPTTVTIQQAINRIIDRAGRTGARRLYVYFAGHGLTASLSHLLLLAANAQQKSLNRGINAQKYQEGLGNLPLFSEQLFFYDCCRYYDGRVWGQDPDWTPESPDPPVPLTRMILYGAGFKDFANERPIVGSDMRGLFTVALLEGLVGGAATSAHGEYQVTAAELGRFVPSRLSELARAEGLQQDAEPHYLGNPDDFVLVRHVIPCWKTIVVTLPSAGAAVVVRDESMNEVYRQPITGGHPNVVLQLRPGRYVVQIVPDGPGRIIEVGSGPTLTIDLRDDP